MKPKCILHCCLKIWQVIENMLKSQDGATVHTHCQLLEVECTTDVCFSQDIHGLGAWFDCDSSPARGL